MQCLDIVMELMDGGDLLQYILDNEGLTEYHTQQIAYQISDALAVSDYTNHFSKVKLTHDHRCSTFTQ